MSSGETIRAIADPTRREILDLLRDQGVLNAGAIAANFPAQSRPGISRHLRVLRECGVVTVRREGKAQNYRLDATPLSALREGWLATFSTMQRDSLRALRQRVES